MSARWGYRRLLRSARHAFKADVFAVDMARLQLREEFLKNKHVVDKAALDALLRGIDEVDEMLRFNVVQGTRNDRGNYEVGLAPEHHVTIEAGQDLPHGPELAVADPSLLGTPSAVKVEKSKATKVPFTEVT